MRRILRESPLPPAIAALHWLASRQNVDGSWGSGYEEVSGEMWTPAGATSLSVMAFFSLGWTHASKEQWKAGAPGEVVGKAEKWLRGYLPWNDREEALVALAMTAQKGGGWGGEIATTGAVVRNALGSMSLVHPSRTSSSIDGPPVALPPLEEETIADLGTGMGDDAPLDSVQDSGSDLPMGDSAPLEAE